MKPFFCLPFRLTLSLAKSRCRLSGPYASLLTPFLLFCSPSAIHAQWEPDVRLTYNDSASQTSFNNAWCVGASKYTVLGSSVHVVWCDRRDGNRQIYYKRSQDEGATWGLDTRLTYTSTSSFDPAIAVTGIRVHVVWADRRDGGQEIYYKHSTDGGATWGPDARLTNDTVGSSRPSLAVSGFDIHAVWYKGQNGNTDIYTTRSVDGGTTWEPETRLTTAPGWSLWPSVAVSGSQVHVAWDDDRNGAPQIFYKRSDDSGATWRPDTALTLHTNYSSDYPSVAVSGSDFYVTWQDSRNGNEEIYFKRSSNGGRTWGADARLTNDSALSLNPSIAASGSDVHIVWQNLGTAGVSIFSKSSTDSGTTWGADTCITNSSSNPWNASLALSGRNVHVVWQDGRDGNDEIYYKREVVEPEERGTGGKFYALPNPFTAYTWVVGHEQEDFYVYDIIGRLVGTYKGDRIGENLVSGIYFLKPEGNEGKPLRIVKLR